MATTALFADELPAELYIKIYENVFIPGRIRIFKPSREGKTAKP